LSLHLASLPWAAIIWPCVSLFLVEGLIVFIRWFGKFETSAEAVGSDLNLITFGFAVDLLVKMMQGRPVLPKWPFHLPVLVPALALFIVNLVLYLCNLRLAERIAASIKAGKSKFLIGSLRCVSFFLGVISAAMFISAEALWD